MNLPQIVAHRGYAQHFPENTLSALEAAVAAGARHIEFDVQLTADGVPVLLHDADLERTSNQPGQIFELTSSEATAINVGEPKRFGEGTFAQANIPTLASVIERLAHWPEVTAFVEVKEESLKRFGMEKAVKIILDVLHPALQRCVVISYDILALRCARAMGARSIGWVLPAWNEDNHIRASELVPDYMFVNYLKVPVDEPLWRGPWAWAMYEVTDVEIALALAERGAQLIETMAVGGMLESLPRKAHELAARSVELPPSAPLPSTSRALPRRLLKPAMDQSLAEELAAARTSTAPQAAAPAATPAPAAEEKSGSRVVTRLQADAVKATRSHTKKGVVPAPAKAKAKAKNKAVPKTKAGAKAATARKAATATKKASPSRKSPAKTAVRAKKAATKKAPSKRAAFPSKKARGKTSTRRK